MGKSRLELRAWRMVGVGYLVAPVFGLTAWWLILTLSSARDPMVDWEKVRLLWALMILFGVPICFVIELVFVTPILLWFRRLRWPWLNGWRGAAIGFGLGAGAWLAFGLLSSSSLDGLAVMRMARESLGPGVVGLVTAVVFRLIAIRTLSDEAR